MIVHVLLSIAAAALLTAAALQSLLLALQEHLLHDPNAGSLAGRLPPLQAMERLLFNLLTAGFVLLSAALLSGLWFIEDWLAPHLVNKTVLSLCAWVIFGVLLWGRRRYGWRGRAATRWALSGYAVLLVAYFSSRYIIEQYLIKTNT